MSGGLVVAKKKVTTLDKIRKYYLKGPENVRLSPSQDQTRIQVFKAWNLLLNYHSKEQAIKVLMHDDDTPCSRAQAYRYLTMAESVFGTPTENRMEAERHLILEDLMRLQQRAIKAKDLTLELNVIKQRIKLAGFDKQKDPKFDPEKLQAQVYVLKIAPEAAAAIEKAKEGGSYDFNMLDTEDIPYKEVDEEEADED